MVAAQPHYLLFCDAHFSDSSLPQANENGNCSFPHTGFGRWHFVLERLDGPERLEAADSEPEILPDRIALLAVVRGLEALEQPSQVRLVTTSRYVARGMKYGLNTWKESNYQWERFGVQMPVRNADLWQRVDTALEFHVVTCRLIQAAAGMGAAVQEVEQSVPMIAGGRHPVRPETQMALPASEERHTPRRRTPRNTLELARAKVAYHIAATRTAQRDALRAKSEPIERGDLWGVASNWLRGRRAKQLQPLSLYGT